MLDRLDVQIHVKVRPVQMMRLRPLDMKNRGYRGMLEPRELVERKEQFPLRQEKPKPMRGNVGDFSLYCRTHQPNIAGLFFRAKESRPEKPAHRPRILPLLLRNVTQDQGEILRQAQDDRLAGGGDGPGVPPAPEVPRLLVMYNGGKGARPRPRSRQPPALAEREGKTGRHGREAAAYLAGYS